MWRIETLIQLHVEFTSSGLALQTFSPYRELTTIQNNIEYRKYPQRASLRGEWIARLHHFMV